MVSLGLLEGTENLHFTVSDFAVSFSFSTHFSSRVEEDTSCLLQIPVLPFAFQPLIHLELTFKECVISAC